MIRITVELCPKGDTSNPKLLGTAMIYNDLSGDLNNGNYNAIFYKKGFRKVVWKKGRVENFPRKKLLVWDLMYRALEDIVGQRNKKNENDDQIQLN